MMKVIVFFLCITSAGQAFAEGISLDYPCVEIERQEGSAYAPFVAIHPDGGTKVVTWLNVVDGNRTIKADYDCDTNYFTKLFSSSDPPIYWNLFDARLRGIQTTIDSSGLSHHFCVTENGERKHILRFANSKRGFEKVVEVGSKLNQIPLEPSLYKAAIKRNGDLVLVRFIQDPPRSRSFKLQAWSRSKEDFIDVASSTANHYFRRKIFLDRFAVAFSESKHESIIWEEQIYPATLIKFSEKVENDQWSAPQKVYSFVNPGYIGDLEMAINEKNQLAVVWSVVVPASRRGGQRCQIYGMFKNESGNWIGPEILSESNREIRSLKIAINSDGNSMALWEEEDGLRHEVKAAYRPNRFPWQPAVMISNDQLPCRAPKIQGCGNGFFLSMWEEHEILGSVIKARLFQSEDAQWTKPTNISKEGVCTAVSFSVEGGNGIAAWLRHFKGEAQDKTVYQRFHIVGYGQYGKHNANEWSHYSP